MNILMYADAFGGNTTTFINNEIEYLSKRHNLTFACIVKKDSGIFSFKNVVKLPFKNSLLSRILDRLDIYLRYKDNNFKKELNALINKVKPDIIHCHFGKEALKILDNLEDKTIPVIIHFHGYDASSALRKKAYVRKLKEVLSYDNVYPIFVAKYLKKNLQNCNIEIKKEKILHCGINMSKFVDIHEKKLTEEKFIFLQVSSLVEKKGHEYTIKAFSKFLEKQQTKNFELILTGDGKRKIILEQLVLELNLENYVRFVGFVSPDEAVELMKNANVFVHHSITASNGDQEGIPTSIMEAMAMNLPILSTKHSGIPELVKDGVNGFLVEEKDINDYALKMNNIISWTKENNNRKIIEEEFEMLKHNKFLESFYLNIITK